MVKQISIQLDDDTRRMIAELAEWYGLSSTRNNTAVIRRLVVEAHTREKSRRELAEFDKVKEDELQ